MESPVRHSGRVLVRGRYRRVWRPRRLALLDHGVVQYSYYEEPSSVLVLWINACRILDATTLRDMHVGLPRGAFGFVFLATNGAHEPEREYFCAVSTLEEAQAWVVALQWAADQRGTNYNQTRPMVTTTTVLRQEKLATDDVTSSSWEHAEAPSVKSDATTTSTVWMETNVTYSVVTKVVPDVRMVRVRSFHFEPAYEIRVLMTPSLESWKLLRTAQDVQNLQNDIHRETLQTIDTILLLPSNYTLSSWIDSLQQVEQLLKRVVLNETLLNTRAVQNFLGLGQTHSLSLWTWLHPHNPRAVMDRHTVTQHPTRTIKQTVKQWLLQSAQPSSSSSWNWCVFQFTQRPLLVLGGLGATTASIWPLTLWWWRTVPTYRVRLDVLVASWIGAAYVGKNMYTSKTSVTTKGHSAKEVKSSTSHKKNNEKSTELGSNESTDGVIVSDTMTDEDIISQVSLEGEDDMALVEETERRYLSSPLPKYPDNNGTSCWSEPMSSIFHVRGPTYLKDRIKMPSDPAPLTCRGVDIWLTDNPCRHIARHPDMLGGELDKEDTFLVNFLLPFGNFVAYFSVPPLSAFPKKLRNVWTNFLKGDQQYRDARLKLLPIVLEGPWIVKAAVGPGKSPALLGKVIPLQYYFRDPDRNRKGVYEVDVIITASTIAKGILSVVKGHTTSVSIGFAFIIEAATPEELPETVLCAFQIHSLNLEECPELREYNFDDI